MGKLKAVVEGASEVAGGGDPRDRLRTRCCRRWTRFMSLPLIVESMAGSVSSDADVRAAAAAATWRRVWTPSASSSSGCDAAAAFQRKDMENIKEKQRESQMDVNSNAQLFVLTRFGDDYIT